jgi:alcohol dehydrogenase (cytochrome c)/quinohemoprotein ethanol dehydrogenase
LAAWDPVTQQEVWRVQHPGPWNGGILSTGGGLVFQGNAKGELVAYGARAGEKLWGFDAQTGIVAAPVSYSVNGKQYVSVVAGWGGIFPLITGELSHKSGSQRNISRVLTFSLDGDKALPPTAEEVSRVPSPPDLVDAQDMTMVAKGKTVYSEWCGACHGDRAVSGGVTPDLRYSGFLHSDAWYQVVLDGLLTERGMVGFSADLSREDARAIRAYLVTEAQLTRKKLTSDKNENENE